MRGRVHNRNRDRGGKPVRLAVGVGMMGAPGLRSDGTGGAPHSDPAPHRPLSLLKIQFGTIEGRDKQRGASPILCGSTLITMMQAADLREGNYVTAYGRWLYGTRPWTVFVERKMRSRVRLGEAPR